jgi:hypothetical protein
MILESLAAANAAYAIISNVVKNGAEITKAGRAIADFTNAKDAVDKACRSKGTNLDGSKSDLQEFMAQEKVRELENKLRSDMQLYGRAGMYQAYVKFCAEARTARAEAAKQARLRAIQRQDTIMTIIYWLLCLAIGAFALFLIIAILLEANNV